MQPFNFSIHKTSELFRGNGVSKSFAFTTIPALTKTDIQLVIYDETLGTEIIIDYDNFTFNVTSSYVGFIITLDDTINAPISTQLVICKLVRAIKNETVFTQGSTPSPLELTYGYQGLCLSIASLLSSISGGTGSGITFPISDTLLKISSLNFPSIDTNLDKFNLAMRKRQDGKYEFFYDDTASNSNPLQDVAKIDADYVASKYDKEINILSSSLASGTITLYRHLDVQEGYGRHTIIRNDSSYNWSIKYANNIIGIIKAKTELTYSVDSNRNCNLLSADSTYQTYYVGDYKYSAQLSDHANWLLCDGRFIHRVDYPNLFQAIGTSFNYDGIDPSTFRLPDFRGMVPGGIGQGPGLTNRALGNRIGAEYHVLTQGQLPSYNLTDIRESTLQVSGQHERSYASGGFFNRQTWNVSIPSGGNDQGHNNMQPTNFAGNYFIYSGM